LHWFCSFSLWPVILSQTYERLAPGEPKLRHHIVYKNPGTKFEGEQPTSNSRTLGWRLNKKYIKLNIDLRDNEVL
jgi:hypothetical protein